MEVELVEETKEKVQDDPKVEEAKAENLDKEESPKKKKPSRLGKLKQLGKKN
jgi:hypothetical protein